MATASHPGPGGHMGHMGPASTSNVSLCPIDIDLECDGVFVREQFTWSLAEGIPSIQAFAIGLVKERGLNLRFSNMIIESMIKQLSEYRIVEERARSLAMAEPERLEVLKISVRSGLTQVEDQITWDVHNREADPEAFAAQMCRDLDLCAPFETLIAHKIREQVHRCRKAFIEACESSKRAKEAAAYGVGRGAIGGMGTKPPPRGKAASGGGRLAPAPAGSPMPKPPLKPLSRTGVERPLAEQRDFAPVINKLSEDEAAMMAEMEETKGLRMRKQAMAQKIEENREKAKKKKTFSGQTHGAGAHGRGGKPGVFMSGMGGAMVFPHPGELQGWMDPTAGLGGPGFLPPHGGGGAGGNPFGNPFGAMGAAPGYPANRAAQSYSPGPFLPPTLWNPAQVSMSQQQGLSSMSMKQLQEQAAGARQGAGPPGGNPAGVAAMLGSAAMGTPFQDPMPVHAMAQQSVHQQLQRPPNFGPGMQGPPQDLFGLPYFPGMPQ